MQVFQREEMDATPGHPRVLASSPEGRAVALRLNRGQALKEHQVYERAWLAVAGGRVRVRSEDGAGAQEAGAGSLVVFDPKERHEIEAIDDAELLLVLTPWPGADRPPEDQPRW